MKLYKVKELELKDISIVKFLLPESGVEITANYWDSDCSLVFHSPDLTIIMGVANSEKILNEYLHERDLEYCNLAQRQARTKQLFASGKYNLKCESGGCGY